MTPQVAQIVVSSGYDEGGSYATFDFLWYEKTVQQCHHIIKLEGCNVNDAFGQAASQVWDVFQDFINDSFQEEDKQEVLPNVLG